MGDFLRELRRRKVVSVAGVYAVVGWLIAQAAGVLENALVMPAWFDTVVVSGLLLGFPLALVLAWAFELTTEGVKRTAALAEGGDAEAAPVRRLDYAILAGVALIVALFIGDRMMPEAPSAKAPAQPVAAVGVDEPGAAVPSGQPGSDAQRKPGAAPAASIAVLPFADLSPGGDQQYFSDGVAEEILNVLARIDGLKVASRTSSFQFRSTAAGVPVIARELGVRHVLEGSVRKAGNAIRVTAQLIDADTDAHLWSDTYDRPLTTETVFAIQDDIANAIVGALRETIQVDVAVPGKVARQADTANLDAYELYLKGRGLFVARGRSNLIDAMDTLQEATRLDPGFARAYETLAGVYAVAPSWQILDRDYLALARATADQALSLDPSLSLPYAVRGYASRMAIVQGKATWDASLADFEEAIRRDPKDATAVFWRGIEFHTLGYFDLAIKDYEACLALDPAYENCRRWMAKTHMSAGRTDEALRLYEVGLERGFFNQDNQFVEAYLARGNRIAALAILAESFSQNKPIISPLYRALTDPKFPDADRQAALDLLARMPELSRNEAEPALWLRAYDSIPESDIGQSIVWWFRGDPAFLKSEQRKKIMRAWRLPEYWREHGFPPQCRAVGADDFACD